MGKISIVKADITTLETDAIVNAANEALRKGTGVCGAIFKAAGSRELQVACEAIGSCKTGYAVITPGFGLKAKFIIHAVGPRWTDGKHGEPNLLYGAYSQSLLLAVQNGCKAVGFPLISAGVYGYPVDKAWGEAIRACLDFQRENPGTNLDIQFAAIDDKIIATGRKILKELNKEKTSIYLKLLDANSLQRIRERIRDEASLFIDKKANPTAGGLMSVICDPKVIDLLSVDQLIKVVESIFHGPVLDENWISKYGGVLLRAVNESKKKKKDARAEKYEKYMTEVLVPSLNASTRSGSVLDDLELLESIYKVAVCLYRFYHEKETRFVFDVDLESMEKLNKAVQKINTAGNNVPGFKIIFPIGTEDRQYATFMSWVLEELLSKHEGLKEGDK